MTLRTALLRVSRMGSPQRRLGLLRLSAMGSARRAARQRGVLAGVVLALLTASPSLQVAGPVSLATPMAAPVPPPVLPAGAEPGQANGTLTGSTQPVSIEPVAFHPVSVRQHRIQVEGVMPNGLVAARTVEGVAFATAVKLGEIPVALPASPPTPVRVAAVDLGEFRVLTAQPIADAVTLWENVAAGDVAFTHEVAGKLGAQLGQAVTMRDGQVRVGAIASNTTPPVADAIVATATGERLGLGQVPQTLLVAVHEGVSPEEVARRLEQRLGARATVIADPRAPRPVPFTGKITSSNVWDLLAMCESGGNWHINTGNGYYGGLQFLPESWYMVGGKGLPHEASREEQIYRATLLLAIQGWKAWPACSLKLGLRKADPGERVYGAPATSPAARPAASGGGGSAQPRTPPPTSEPAPPPSKPTESERDKNNLLRLPPLPG